jgi:hypothetical protein
MPVAAAQVKPDDPRWTWVVYGVGIVPFLGPALLLGGSAWSYYAWRKQYPEATARLNRHVRLAIALNVLVSLVVVRHR